MKNFASTSAQEPANLATAQSGQAKWQSAKSSTAPKWTRASAADFLNVVMSEFEAIGLKLSVVGSVATAGESCKDLDLLVEPLIGVELSLEDALQRVGEAILPAYTVDSFADMNPLPSNEPEDQTFINLGLRDGRVIELFFPERAFPFETDIQKKSSENFFGVNAEMPVAASQEPQCKIVVTRFHSISKGECGPLEYQIVGCKFLITAAAGTSQEKTTVVTLPEAFPAVIGGLAFDATQGSVHSDLLARNFADYEIDVFTGDAGEITADPESIKILLLANNRLGYLFLRDEPTNLTLVEDLGLKVAVNLHIEEDQVLLF